MKVRLKSTGRKDLPQNSIKIDITRKEIPFGDQSLIYPSINSLKIRYADESLKVFLKIKQGRQVISLDFGTIGKIRPPKGEPLKTFTDNTQQLSIDVTLIDPDTNKIKASTKTAIKILPDETPEGESPIAVTFGETGSRLWKLEEIFEDEKPVVTFSKRIESQSRAQSNPIILSSIFPSIIEKLLDFIWENNSQDSDSPWIDYFRKTSFILELDWPDTNDDLRDADAKKDWIERFVNSWSEFNYEITTHRAIKELDHVTEGINEIR